MALPKIIGYKYEKYAEHYLKKQGLVTLARNYHCRLGEIDLIMMHADTLVFVEVRARKSNAFGTAIETVDQRKQNKLIKAAQHFLAQQEKVSYNAIRFDVIGYHTQALSETQWIKNAFFIE